MELKRKSPEDALGYYMTKVMELNMENTALREALEGAPEPEVFAEGYSDLGTASYGFYKSALVAAYQKWYNGPRTDVLEEK